MSRISLFVLCTFFLNLSFAQINVQWEARYEHPANFIDQAVDLELDAAGNTYVTGSSFNGTDYDWVTVKYDASGVEQWVSSYGGVGLDEAQAMDMDNNGDIVVTGSRFISGTDWDIAVVKYNGSTGDQPILMVAKTLQQILTMTLSLLGRIHLVLLISTG